MHRYVRCLWVCNGVGVEVTEPHPSVFRTDHFLSIEEFHCVSESYMYKTAYHSHTKEGEIVLIKPHNSISDAFGEAICIFFKDFCFCSISRLFRLVFI